MHAHTCTCGNSSELWTPDNMEFISPLTTVDFM
jgi:hypothetical protein